MNIYLHVIVGPAAVSRRDKSIPRRDLEWTGERVCGSRGGETGKKNFQRVERAGEKDCILWVLY